MGKPAADALQFESALAGLTGLDGGVLLAWMASENDIEHASWGGDDGAAGTPENWLNIGINGPVYRGTTGTSMWQTPSSGAQATNEFFHGSFSGWGTGNIDTAAILNSAGQSVQAQLNAIQNSGWISGTPGVASYPNLYSAYSLYKGYALPPGAAGAPGTTANTSPASPWTVGTPSNPDQDVWTTINQYCQDAQWYCFSDAETLVVADGVQIMGQRPTVLIDRLDPAVLHAEATWDNTTFQYTTSHLKRARIQRRTSLAKVTSPTEVTVDLICDIDAIRAGDTTMLTRFGPADGLWLVGDCTRSVFQPYSELTLVQAMQPIDALTGLPTSSTTGSSPTGVTVGTGSVKGMTNPLAKVSGLTPQRIDMGVDYAGSGPILAIGSGTVQNAATGSTGWPGISFISIKLDDTTGFPGKFWYVAENIQPTVHTGQQVKVGQQIGTLFNAFPNMETGWASGVGTQTLAESLGEPLTDATGVSTGAGMAANNVLKALGAPGGIVQGTPTSSIPSAYSP